MPPPMKVRKIEHPGIKMTPPADSVSALDYAGRYSPEVIVRGVPWRANLFKHKIGMRKIEELCASLHCKAAQKTPWAFDVDAEFSLVHPINSERITSERFHCIKKSDRDSSVILLRWRKFIVNRQGFIKDDSVTVEIRFWITNVRGIGSAPLSHFADSSDPRHDVALLIDGQKIYVSKQILAFHSPHFHSLFYLDFAERNKSEIELKEVDREEFLELLLVIYHQASKKITVPSTAFFLLELGDRFHVPCAVEWAEKFLVTSTRVSNTEKLRIADLYRLSELKQRCISAFKRKDFSEIKSLGIYDDLSDATKSALSEQMKKGSK